MARAPRDRGTGAVRKLPSGRRQARVLVDGKHISLGSYAQKADANAALRDALGRQDTGTWVDPREGRTTFGTYADDWIAGRHDLAMRTRHDYEDLLRLHLKPAFGTTPLADISVLTVRRWWSRASGPDGHGRAPKTYRLLRGILNTAVEDGLIARNPCRIKGADDTPERPTVTVEQVYAIADAISPRYRALVLLAAFTGLRFGELRALRRKRLDLEASTVTVAPEDGNVQRDRSGAAHFTRPKSRAGARTVAIPARSSRRCWRTSTSSASTAPRRSSFLPTRAPTGCGRSTPRRSGASGARRSPRSTGYQPDWCSTTSATPATRLRRAPAPAPGS